jgi:hypothetical protein
MVHKIGATAERKVEKELLDDLKRVSGKTNILFHIAEAAVDHPDEVVRALIYPAAGGEQTVRDLVREYKSSMLSETSGARVLVVALASCCPASVERTPGIGA